MIAAFLPAHLSMKIVISPWYLHIVEVEVKVESKLAIKYPGFSM